MNDSHAISETYLRLADVPGEPGEDTRKRSLGTTALLSLFAVSKIVLAALVVTTFSTGQGAIMNDALADHVDTNPDDTVDTGDEQDTNPNDDLTGHE